MVGSLHAVEERLKNQKVLIIIDDLEDQMVLDTLVGQTQWFGFGSRIIVITKNKQFLRAHGVVSIYEVRLPSQELALQMFCRFCFRQNFPPDGLMEFASEVALYSGNLPLGLKVLGSYLRGRDKVDLIEMLPRLKNGLDGKIEKTLRVSYDGLNDKKDQALFRHIACLFNGETVNEIKLLLADSGLDVNIGFKNLVDRSLVHVRFNIVEMHSLLQKMGKEIVHAQSNEPGEREFLMDSKDICDVLENNTGTKKVLGLTLDMDEIDELHIHGNAFKEMRNLLFLKMYNKKRYQKKRVRWHVQEGFDYLPHTLRLLRLDGYPMRSMPSNFRPANLVKLQMQGSNLERLWEGVHPLRGLKEIDLKKSIHLKEIPDLSMATNLEKLDLSDCSSLVELPSSIQSLNKLERLIMSRCSSLETLPSGINLESLYKLDLERCSQLNIFPNISTNISELILSYTSIDELPSDMHLENLLLLSMQKEKLWNRIQSLAPFMATLPHSLKSLFLSEIPILVELPSCLQNFTKLEQLGIRNCTNMETLPAGINFQYLDYLNFGGCSRLKTFPNISTNVKHIILDRTGIQEVPWWIENFSMLTDLIMNGCNNLQSVSLHISKLKGLEMVDFSNCGALGEASWDNRSSDVAMETDNVHSKSLVLEESYSSFPEDFINCFKFNYSLDKWYSEQQKHGFLDFMMLTGEEVLPYFNHRTTGTSLTNIPLFHSIPSPLFFRFKVCAVVDCKSSNTGDFAYNIHVSCRFKSRLGNHFDPPYLIRVFHKQDLGIHLVIFECSFLLNDDNASLPELIYDRVDINFHLSNPNYNNVYWSELKGCGIRLAEEFSSTEYGDRDEETKRIKKRIKITQEEHET